MASISSFSYCNPSKRGVRIALRPKVNDSSITGSRIVDSILPVGRGQRQSISGDRYTGKTPIYPSPISHRNYLSLSGPIEGLGTKRPFGTYIGTNQNPSKSGSIISFTWSVNRYVLILPPHSPPSSSPPYTSPSIGTGITITNRK